MFGRRLHRGCQFFLEKGAEIMQIHQHIQIKPHHPVTETSFDHVDS